MVFHHPTNDMTADHFEEIYNRYYKDLLRWAGTFFSDAQDREDAVSETFLRILPHAHRVETVESEETARFCYTILRNICINMIKKKGREIPTDFSEETNQKKLDEAALRCHQEKEQSYEVLYRAVDKLPQETREILWLTYRYGLSAKEIGRQYKKSIPAVYQILSRARKQLKAFIQEDNYEKNQ